MQSQACPKSEFGGKGTLCAFERAWVVFFPLVFWGGAAGVINVCVTPGNFCSHTQYAERKKNTRVQGLFLMLPEGLRIWAL